MRQKSKLCRWSCGLETDNKSGICDLCWINRDKIHAKLVALGANRTKNPKRVAAAKRARMARVEIKTACQRIND